VLRDDLGLTGAKYGCGEGRCVRLHRAGGRPGRAVVPVPVEAVAGKPVRTVGAAAGDRLHPGQAAFLEAGANAVRVLHPGMVMAAVACWRSSPSRRGRTS